jgi:hypothetical protein
MVASFQKTTIKIAGIVLLICIIFLALVLYFPSNSQVWPPVIPNCPDYFVDVNGNGSRCLDSKRIINKNNVTIPNFTVSPYIGTNGTCQKYNWATTNKLTWDGITYGAPNPCEALNTSS